MFPITIFDYPICSFSAFCLRLALRAKNITTHTKISPSVMIIIIATLSTVAKPPPEDSSAAGGVTRSGFQPHSASATSL